MFFFFSRAVVMSPLAADPFSVANSSSPTVGGSRPTPRCVKSLGPSKEEYGKLDYDACNRAIAKLPREPRANPTLRNFYVRTEDRSETMPNMEVPVTESDDYCIVELLLESSFEDVPHDQAIWQDLWGPARLILNACVRQQQTGGVVTGIGPDADDTKTYKGRDERLEVVVYDARSIYGYTRILDGSHDPEARSIAMQELLQLLDITPRPDREKYLNRLRAMVDG
ncbi:MAG: hypothetical protein LQ338_007703 [Usnochroma carphineum]|nr:MAG: hypothetical protein LQ338_007703 [Usnochroma carphineum]